MYFPQIPAMLVLLFNYWKGCWCHQFAFRHAGWQEEDLRFPAIYPWATGKVL